MSGQKVCDELLKKSWQKYDPSSVPEKPGIYAIGEKVGSEETKILYVGRSNDMKRRLQEHKTPTPQQDIDKRVAGKFKQHKESELKIKYVPEKRQKTVEGPCIECLTKKKGYSPVLNKRAGDSSTSSAGSQIKSKPQSSGPQVQSSGVASSIRFLSGPKMSSNGEASSIRFLSGTGMLSFGGASSIRSYSGHKVLSSGGASSIRSSLGSKVRSSGGASSIRSFSGPHVRSSGGASSVRSFSGPNVRLFTAASCIRSFAGSNVRSSGGASFKSLSRSVARPVTGRASFRSFGRRK